MKLNKLTLVKIIAAFIISISLINCGGGGSSGDSSQEGVAEGMQEGTTEGTQEGTTEGASEGVTEGNQEGSQEGFQEGNSEGNQEEGGSESGYTISGSIDSSLIDQLKINKVLIFEGTVSSDTITTGIDPVLTANVSQNTASLLWNYSVNSEISGTYTIAVMTSESDFSKGGASIAVNKIITANIPAEDSYQANFTADNIITVGANGDYPTPSTAYPYVEDGDVIEIEAGTYENDIVVWRQNNITLRGVNGKAHLHASNTIEYEGSNDQKNGKGIWVIRGDNVRVENIEFSGATVPDENGAGIRLEGENLYISNCYFHNNENGILGGYGTTLVEFSEFANNGYGGGYTHNIYIGNYTDKFIFRYSNSHHAKVGHNIKSRAAENIIKYSRIMDEANGYSSYGIDLPNGGDATIIGNIIQQGANAENNKLISYGAEGISYDSNSLNIINNTIINQRSSATYIRIAGGITANLTNNLFIGDGTLVSGEANLSNNLQFSSDPGVVDFSGYDFHLTSSVTTAINSGTDLNSSLIPSLEYSHNSRYSERENDGHIDIGAYEYH
ncbi:MAG: hypothetical protein D6B27_09595 [Gammaproteobacteria bacterium]|nr:MAG: hypothetical protein D6B27_09595 [Gammaproteobacteria bacterium]